MSSDTPLALKEYRCRCGKLLFRALMSASVVEVKCRRCGEIRVFDDEVVGSRTFTLAADKRGRIVDACDGVIVLGWNRLDVIGQSLETVLPLAWEASHRKALITKSTLKLTSRNLLLRDRKATLESHIVPSHNSHYYVFSLVKYLA